MSDTPGPDISLPPDLRPTDGRFGPGPSKVRPDAVADLAKAADTYLGTSHRRPTVRNVVASIRRQVTELLSLPAGYEVAIGNGGTTAFWDAACFGLIERRSEHVSFGEFSSKFATASAAAPHLYDPVVIEADPGVRPPEPVVDDTVDAYCLTHNETSTGVAAEIRRPDDAGLVLVDATSAAGGLRIDPTQFDAYYFAPQKCLASDGGLWLAACSPAAIERIERIEASGRWQPAFLSLPLALDNSRKDQTYNTPALATLYLLDHQLGWIMSQGGLEWAVGRCDRNAEIVYGWATASEVANPFVTDEGARSHTVATVDLHESVDALTVAGVLRANGIVDVEPYRKLGRNQLRIAMFPAIEPGDLERLTACIDHVVAQLQ